MRGAILWLVALLAACAPPVVPDSPEACRVTELTTVPIEGDPRRPGLTVAINGKPATMLLDTGATGLTLGTEAIRRLGVREDFQRQFTITTAGGVVFRRAFEIDTLMIGSEKVERIAFPEMTGSQIGGRGFDGVLGVAAFANHDVEIDFPARRLRLYQRRYCPSGAPPWATPYAAFRRAEGRFSRSYRPSVEVRLNGRTAHALLDSGATSTVVDRALATSLGAPAVPPPGAPTSQIGTMGDGMVTTWRHGFSELAIGPIRITNPQLWVMDLANSTEMLIGMDVLVRYRLWLSNGSETVYIGAPQPRS